MAADAQVVLIRRPISDYDALNLGGEWRYCARSVGRFALLVRFVGCAPINCSSSGPFPSGPINEVDSITVSGGYVAYRAIWSGRATGEDYQVRMFDTAHRRTISGAIHPSASPARDRIKLLLSSAGVAAWISTAGADDPYRYGPFHAEVRALGARTGPNLILDSEPVSGPNDPGDLANLRLYQCLAGCVGPAAVVAWTHAGVWRCAQVA
jgi:hypothetical protein